MEWWKIIVLGYVFLYVGLLIYQILDSRNKNRDKIKYAMEQAEKQDEKEKRMEKVNTLIDKPPIAETATKSVGEYSVGILSSFQKGIVDLIYSLESVIRQQIEWMHDILLSNIYIFLRKIGFL
jgi:hypothetical protein